MTPEEVSRAEVLAAVERVAGRVEGLQHHVGEEFKGLRQELAQQALQVERRLTDGESERRRWFDSTWPSAQRLVEAIDARTAALERSQVTAQVVDALHARIDKQGERLRFLETWRAKMVGLAAGVGAVAGLLVTLVGKLLEK